MVFDAPKMKKPFKERYERLKKIFDKKDSKYVKLLEHTVC